VLYNRRVFPGFFIFFSPIQSYPLLSTTIESYFCGGLTKLQADHFFQSQAFWMVDRI
jgi:hypothetical protein